MVMSNNRPSFLFLCAGVMFIGSGAILAAFCLTTELDNLKQQNTAQAEVLQQMQAFLEKEFSNDHRMVLFRPAGLNGQEWSDHIQFELKRQKLTPLSIDVDVYAAALCDGWADIKVPEKKGPE